MASYYYPSQQYYSVGSYAPAPRRVSSYSSSSPRRRSARGHEYAPSRKGYHNRYIRGSLERREVGVRKVYTSECEMGRERECV
jgi:hypothetical protein